MKRGSARALLLAGSMLFGAAAGIGAAPLGLCADTLTVSGDEPFTGELMFETDAEIWYVPVIGGATIVLIGSVGTYVLSDGTLLEVACSVYVVV